MNHQPFEEWLLDDVPLTIQQERDLQVHLRSCTTCAAIANSNLALRSKRLIAPMPGFTDRFRPRLAAWRRQQLRRQAVGTIILVLAGLALLYGLSGPAMLSAVRSPAQWLMDVTAQLLALLTFLSVLGRVAGVLLRDLPGLAPPAVWLVVVIVACGLAALWITTMRRLARAPQGGRR